jgi:KDO2-lipid IV(A) lauroyltransferase
MNQPAGFFLGPATLANITHYPVYFVRVHRVERGFYEIELLEICKEPQSISQEALIERYVELAEETIRLQPESYLWSNRRWKRTPPKEFLADQATLTESAAASGDIQSNP